MNHGKIFLISKIISVAFATGTYVSIFSMPWELSIQYSIVRFIILMLIAILGMTGWLLYAHQLIERKTAKSQRVYRYIYNFTTIFTLFIITLLNYIILYLLLAISVSLFVPPSLFNQWTSAHPHFTFINYVKLVWFVSSLGLLAGAMGSTVENEEKIVRLLIRIDNIIVIKKQNKRRKKRTSSVISHDASNQQVEESASNKQNKDNQQDEHKTRS